MLGVNFSFRVGKVLEQVPGSPKKLWCPVPVGTQGQLGWGPVQAELLGGSPACSREGWNWMIFQVPSNPNHSLILWKSCDLLSVPRECSSCITRNDAASPLLLPVCPKLWIDGYQGLRLPSLPAVNEVWSSVPETFKMSWVHISKIQVNGLCKDFGLWDLSIVLLYFSIQYKGFKKTDPERVLLSSSWNKFWNCLSYCF